ncbi:MAG: IS5 family transposase [Duodenibacillus sp.]
MHHTLPSEQKRIFRGPSDQQFLFLDRDLYLACLSKRQRNRLMMVAEANLEVFRPILLKAIEKDRLSRKGKNDANLSSRGRRAMDPVLMLRCLCLQRYYNQSDEQFAETLVTNLLVQDCLSISSPKDLPKAKTLWKYREIFVKHGIFQSMLNSQIKEQTAEIESAVPGLTKRNVTIDASFVEAPKQRNSREENAAIKDGRGDDLWRDQPNKRRHKDLDARWTKKHGKTYYGYKAHVVTSAATNLVIDLASTSAAVHDAKIGPDMITRLRPTGMVLADAGYLGSRMSDAITACGAIPMIAEKPSKVKKLDEQIGTDLQRRRNKVIASTRCRIEHIFGYVEKTLKGSTVRSVGMARAAANICLTFWLYNLHRWQLLTSPS